MAGIWCGMKIFSVIEERMPPCAQEQRHWHSRSRQFFYVLEGELIMQFDNESVRIPVRHGLEIAPATSGKECLR